MFQFGPDEELPSPIKDLAFKSIFTQDTPESKGALMDFLSSVIGREVTDVVLRPNETAATALQEKRPAMDLSCYFNDGDSANVEVQIENEGNMSQRAEYYLSRLHGGQAVQGDKYEGLHYTYQISILNYRMFPVEKPFLNEFELRDQAGDALPNSRMRMYFMELPKISLDKPVEELAPSEMWAIFLRYAGSLKARNTINQLIQKEVGLAMAGKMLSKLAKDRLEQMYLLSLEKAENDRIDHLLHAEERGEKRGRMMERAAVVNSMKESGMTADQISKILKIPLDELEQ